MVDVKRSVRVMDGVLVSMGDRKPASQKKPPKAAKAPALSPELRELIHMLEAIEAEPAEERDRDR